MPDNSGRVQAIIQGETILLTQKGMSELFGVEVNTINYHLKEIFSTGELTESATIRKIRTVQPEGNRQVERERAFYNLDAIISVGYRVNSQRATRVRQWATRVLNEFICKGYAITGHTAAEIIHAGADHTKPHMGLATWKYAPEGRILNYYCRTFVRQ